MNDSRPSPDKLLERVAQEEHEESHGKLKIYLGAAPGVGKTHEMLEDALKKRSQGLDVLLGIVESHGREEIDSLIQHFDMLPRQILSYRETSCFEFDLDGAIKRNPGLILVDEMAHTNIPGLRHRKRWQDIQELLERGIDVYTTLNVQHIESLKDDVAQIIGAPIHETVPDSMIEKADSIELIDLPPEDLITRLREGKIYIPQQAKLAEEHFFRKGNLIALRELALRVTAERVNNDVLWYRKGEGIKDIWAVKDKILVCVGPKAEALKLIRAAKRLASSLQAEWLAVYIDIPNQPIEDGRNKAIQNLRLAELLGAQTHVLVGQDIVKEIMSFAREHNITQIMIWKHIVTRWRGWFQRNLADEIVHYSEEINVFLITGTSSEPLPKKKWSFKATPWRAYAIAFGVVSSITFLNTFLYGNLAPSNLIMVYLLGVTFIARYGRAGVSVFASILSVAAYDFFFIPPFHTFLITNIQYVLTLFAMLIVTQVISHLTILIQRQATSARLSQHQTTSMYTFSRKLTMTRGVNKILELGTQQIADIFNSSTMALIPVGKQLKVLTSAPLGHSLSVKELSIARWVFDTGRPAGLGTDTLNSSEALYLPLIGASKVQGVLRIQSQQLFTPEQTEFLSSFVNQLALTLETDKLHEKARKSELEIETVHAQTTLLAAIFHDLCFPLQRVINVIKELVDEKEREGRPVDDNIRYEINKLNRLNNNLYQIVELETEEMELRKEPYAIKSIINSAIKKASKTLEKRPIEVILPDNIPLISVDKKYITEVIIHLLDNAIKFSPKNSKITLSVTVTDNNLEVSIEDCGLGIIPSEQKKLFKKFYRGKKVLTEHGLGLGLAICEKIITAHNGIISAENRKAQGAVIRFTLPIQ
jgi:two-component system sensor histidine kinase KdpD